MADTDPQLQAIPGGDPAVPVFGARTGTLDERKYRRFGIEIETDTDRWVEEFDAYFDPDAGAILSLMNARTEWQQANATAFLLRTSLRDDDGVPASWSPPAEPEYDEDGEVAVFGPDEVDDADDTSPRYRWHDGALLTEGELRDAIAEFDNLADGSSRRRFAYLADSGDHRMQMQALTDLAEWVIGDAAKRPTRRPTSSARGPQRTSRTSGGKRSGGRA